MLLKAVLFHVIITSRAIQLVRTSSLKLVPIQSRICANWLLKFIEPVPRPSLIFCEPTEISENVVLGRFQEIFPYNNDFRDYAENVLKN